MALTDGVTPLNAANLPHKAGDDTLSGLYEFLLPVATAGGYNWLENASFEKWLPDGSRPKQWSRTGAGSSSTRDVAAANVQVGDTSVALARAGADCYLAQRIDTLRGKGPIGRWQSAKVTVGCLVKASVASRAKISIFDSAGQIGVSSFHTGGGAYELLIASGTVGAAATSLEVRLEIVTGDTTANFDGAVFVLGKRIQAFILPGYPGYAEEPESSFNWIFNGDFEIWGAGAAAVPTGWTATGSPTIAKDTTDFYLNTAGVKVTRAAADAFIAQAIHTNWPPASSWRRKWVTYGCWVKGNAAGVATVSIADDAGETVSAANVGTGFEFLPVTRFVDSATATLNVRNKVAGVGAVATFDGATLILGQALGDLIPEDQLRGRKSVLAFGSTATQAQATTSFYGPWGTSTTEVQVSFRVPFKCVARNLYVELDVNVGGAAQTAIATLRKSETTDTALTVTISTGARAGQDVTNEVELAAGEIVTVKVVLSATTGALRVHGTIEIEQIP